MSWKEAGGARSPLKDRARALAEKIKSGKVGLPDLLARSLSSLGRFRVSSVGLEVEGRFRLDRETLEDLARFASDAMGLYRLFFGAEVFLQVREVGAWRIRLGLPPEIRPASGAEVARTPSAVVEVDPGILSYFFMGSEGLYLIMSGDAWKVRRLNVLTDRIDGDWSDSARFFDPVASLMALTRKQNAAVLGPALSQWADEVLTGLGV